ncbi:MAG: BON domain-containing protein [Alphaproteobacteria bacterium]
MMMNPQARRAFFSFGLLLAAGANLALGACAPVVVGTGVAVGVAASQERGLEGTASDTKIRLEIDRLWLAESTSLFSEIGLQVQEGRVLLTGQVPEPEARVTAVRLAWQAEDVIEVINEIVLGDQSSLSNAARDEWIAAQLRARLLGDAAIASINYSIETVNGSVYLIGIAQDQAELDRVIAYARNITYVRRVVNYMRLKTDPTP